MQKNTFIKRYQQLGWTHTPVKPRDYLRINPLRAPPNLIEQLAERGVTLTKVPWLTHGYRIDDTPFSLGSTVEYLLGYYYLQNAAAQLPVEILAPQPGTLVLDCCASPGGKTTQLAAHMNNTGTIISIEKKKERLKRLTNNLERLGIANTLVYHKDARNVAELGLTYDAILLDAPCSGNFTQEKNWFAKRKLEDIALISDVQKELLKQALLTLKPGHRLIYSTCSLEPEENELVIDYAIKELGAHVIPITTDVGVPGLTTIFSKTLHPSIAGTRRLWPGETEGFYIATLTLKP